mmetsp:Transcript_20189/g.20559  ORF Transcript_20189/g.20559 Transcript_20189/m.20559 type:complete len:87 (-) Transcript_20189:514-774(-)
MVYVDVTNRPTTKGVNYEDRSFLVPELGKNNVKSGATYFKIIVVIVPTYIYIPVRPGIQFRINKEKKTNPSKPFRGYVCSVANPVL